MQCKKKIILYDSWTEGAIHFIRLLDEFRKLDVEVFLLHVGSWQHDKNRPLEEVIDGLTVRDIAYYNGKSMKSILEIERPDAILFLSLRAFSHLALNRIARYMGIKTFHLQHGLISAEAQGENFSPADSYKISKKKMRSLFFNSFIPVITKIFPCYLYALKFTRAEFNQYFWFIHELFNRLKNKSTISVDSYPDHIFVYTDADAKIVNSAMGVSSTVVGVPDLYKFGFDRHDIGCRLGLNAISNSVLYIESALDSTGLIFDSLREYKEYLRNLNESLNRNGLVLTMRIKPHPASRHDELSKFLTDLGCRVSENTFYEDAKHCYAVITESSSLSIVPILLGTPLLMPQIGKFKQHSFGPLITLYPRSEYLVDVNDLVKIVSGIVADGRLSIFAKEYIESLLPSNQEDFCRAVVAGIKIRL